MVKYILQCLLIWESLVVVTGLDRPGSGENLEVLRELLDRPWPLLAVSATQGTGLPELAARSFEVLDLIRVYTKEPGKPADREKPFTLPRGSSVADLALHIHRDLALGLRFARIWGKSAFDGQSVKGEHRLEDGDVVELHTA